MNKKDHKFIEQRKTSRIERLHFIEINLKDGRSFIGKTRNLSHNGAYIIREKENPLQKGDNIEFNIILSETNSELDIKGKGKVVRKNDTGMGISFEQLEDNDYSRLRDLIAFDREKSGTNPFIQIS